MSFKNGYVLAAISKNITLHTSENVNNVQTMSDSSGNIIIDMTTNPPVMNDINGVVMINTSTRNFIGNVVGNLLGNVIDDNDNVMVDTSVGNFYGNLTGNIYDTSGNIILNNTSGYQGFKGNLLDTLGRSIVTNNSISAQFYGQLYGNVSTNGTDLSITASTGLSGHKGHAAIITAGNGGDGGNGGDLILNSGVAGGVSGASNGGNVQVTLGNGFDGFQGSMVVSNANFINAWKIQKGPIFGGVPSHYANPRTYIANNSAYFFFAPSDIFQNHIISVKADVNNINANILYLDMDDNNTTNADGMNWATFFAQNGYILGDTLNNNQVFNFRIVTDPGVMVDIQGSVNVSLNGLPNLYVPPYSERTFSLFVQDASIPSYVLY